MRVHEQFGMPGNRNYLYALDWQCSHPDDLKHIMTLHSHLTTLGEHKHVVQHWDRFIEQNPSNPKAYLMRGVTQTTLKAYEPAQADFKRACELGEQPACERLAPQPAQPSS